MAFTPITTTLNRIHACNPCNDGWQKGLAAAGKAAPDDDPITYVQILDAVGLEGALWTCRAEPRHSRLWRLLAIWYARRVQHLMTDARSVAALNVSERYVNGQATDAELAAARAAAKAAAWAVARAVAGTVAGDAAWAAARAAARDAAWAVAGAAAWAVTWAVARDAEAGNAERQAQADAFRLLVTTGKLPN